MSFLDGAVDLHVHSAPDLLPRRYSDVDLAERARRSGMRAIVLKCHFESTVGRAAATAAATGLEVHGGLVLNHRFSGGVHPKTVSAALGLGARIVWMPTVTSAAHRHFYGDFDEAEALDPWALREICEAVAAHDAVLATGHWGRTEIETLLEVAAPTGVTVLLTHPDFEVPDLSIDWQAQVARDFPRVRFERCAYMCLPGAPSPRPSTIPAAAIEATGGRHRNVISSDLGQPELPDYPSGLEEFCEMLVKNGIDRLEVEAMVSGEPLRLLRGRDSADTSEEDAR